MEFVKYHVPLGSVAYQPLPRRKYPEAVRAIFHMFGPGGVYGGTIPRDPTQVLKLVSGLSGFGPLTGFLAVGECMCS